MAFETGPCSVVLKCSGREAKTRCLSAQAKPKENLDDEFDLDDLEADDSDTLHRFLVGSYSPRDDNLVYLIEFIEESNEIEMRATYSHLDEIHSITTHPEEQQIFATCYRRADGDMNASIWEMDEVKDDDDDNEQLPLKKLLTFDTSATVHTVLWDRVCAEDQVITLDQDTITLWRFDGGYGSVDDKKTIKSEKLPQLKAGCWDVHYPNQFVSVNGRDIKSWSVAGDTFKCLGTIKNAHGKLIRCVDYNPNKPYNIVTASDDRTVRFWDLQNSKKPLKLITGHAHWVWAARLNPFHDQLVVTSGSDNLVKLWSLTSVSSAPSKADDCDKKPDCLISNHTDHNDSVYDVAWSNINAWVFASLSYDGRFVINHVPASQKYDILLDFGDAGDDDDDLAMI